MLSSPVVVGSKTDCYHLAINNKNEMNHLVIYWSRDVLALLCSWLLLLLVLREGEKQTLWLSPFAREIKRCQKKTETWKGMIVGWHEMLHVNVNRAGVLESRICVCSNELQWDQGCRYLFVYFVLEGLK